MHKVGKCLYDIIDKRIGASSFESEELIYRIIDDSGGCLSDLFRLIRNAAEKALDYDRDKISEADYRKGYLRLKRDYENVIAERRDKENKIIISVQEYFQVLIDLSNSSDKKVDNTMAALDLRQNLCILGYNDEWWCDVHPLIKAILRERRLIQ